MNRRQGGVKDVKEAKEKEEPPVLAPHFFSIRSCRLVLPALKQYTR
jgi:hypothetical protein